MPPKTVQQGEEVKRIAPWPFADQPPIEQRLRLISEENRVELATIGIEAGLSRETIRQWIAQARENPGKLPGYPKSHARVAKRWSVPLAWLVSQEKLAPGSRPPVDEPKSSELGEALRLLRRALEILEQIQKGSDR